MRWAPFNNDAYVSGFYFENLKPTKLSFFVLSLSYTCHYSLVECWFSHLAVWRSRLWVMYLKPKLGIGYTASRSKKVSNYFGSMLHLSCSIRLQHQRGALCITLSFWLYLPFTSRKFRILRYNDCYIFSANISASFVRLKGIVALIWELTSVLVM
jgi:hypothetical protein